MAKSAENVGMTYKKTVDEAELLEKIAKRTAREAERLFEHRERLSKNWKGENASAYQRKLRKRENELSELSSDLREVARVIKEIAKNTYDAEKEALDIIQKKK